MRHRIWAFLLMVAALLAGAQTALDRSVLRQAEQHLLAMFGLQARPPPSKSNRTVSSYVKGLYDAQQRAGSLDTIRCFKGRDMGAHNSCGSLSVKYKFDLNSSIPPTELLMAAELVLYREAERPSGRPPIYRIQVYDVVRPKSRESDSILSLLDTKVVKGSRSGSWETIDVLPAVRRWLQNPSRNFGLQVQLTSTLNATEPHSVRLKKPIGEEGSQWSEHEPLLVVYSRDPKAKSQSSLLSRTKRSTRKHRRKGRRDNCKRHALYVDFSDVNWDDWIIAPPGYNAYFCHGDCPFPLPDHLNTTNHAIVQMLVNSANPAAVPRPCCVPTELSSISLLYKDQHDVVMLKNYQDMVVEGCGCR